MCGQHAPCFQGPAAAIAGRQANRNPFPPRRQTRGCRGDGCRGDGCPVKLSSSAPPWDPLPSGLIYKVVVAICASVISCHINTYISGWYYLSLLWKSSRPVMRRRGDIWQDVSGYGKVLLRETLTSTLIPLLDMKADQVLHVVNRCS